MTSKQASKATQTTETPTIVDATYAIKGNTKTTRVFYAAIDPTMANSVQAGTIVRLHTSYQGANYGKLIAQVDAAPIDITRGKGDQAVTTQVVRWSFAQLSPAEHRAIGLDPAAIWQQNRVLKAQSQAQFAASDKGAETAQKVMERVAKKQEEAARAMVAEQEAHDAEMARKANVMARQSVPSVVTTVRVPDTTVMAQTTPMPDLATLANALKSAGFSAAEVLAALQAATPVQAPTVQAPQPAPVAPAAVKAPQAPATPSGRQSRGTARHTCPSCGDQEATKLYDHTAGVKVCDPCMNLDAATITARVVKRASN